MRDAAGSEYHFTADLKTGEVYVRPVMTKTAHCAPPSEERTEWTLASGIADLAEYTALVELNERTACTLIFPDQ
jgi:hypothetical protein